MPSISSERTTASAPVISTGAPDGTGAGEGTGVDSVIIRFLF
jgi:hypothetical protein